MDIRELKRIIRLVETSGIDELEIEQEGVRIRVRKGSYSLPHGMVEATHLLPANIPMHPAPQPTQPQGSPLRPAAESGMRAEVAPPPENSQTINSPMVGTFYRSPSPDASFFVQVGSIVEPETVVCILEAMKVMNEIKSGLSGRITEILVENSSAVEFGQPLFRVVPA